MIRKIAIAAGVSALALSFSFAGPASAADFPPVDNVGYAKGVLQQGEDFTSPRQKPGPARLAELQDARRELRELVSQAEAGQKVDPGQIQWLIEKVERLQR